MQVAFLNCQLQQGFVSSDVSDDTINPSPTKPKKTCHCSRRPSVDSNYSFVFVADRTGL